MLPSPTELTYFVEIANTLNISRAAERLGITQPSLSLAVQRLEDSFGLPLLLRGKSGVKLTQAGHRLLGQARSLLSEWERLRGDAIRDEEEVRGRYTLGCHPSVGLYTLPGTLPRLFKDHPGLELKLVHDLSRRITEEVISFRVDFGLVVNPTQHPDLVIKTLFKDEVSLWTGKGSSPLQDPHSGEGVLICEPDLLQTQAILKQVNKAGFKFGRTLTSSNLELVTELVAAGAGVGILPERVARRVKSFGLRPIEGAPVYQDKICLAYRADMQKSKASRTIARTIEQILNPAGTPG
ncbi:MAG: LysR family transcriptional regulator [Bdellovibrionota bacterium]